VALSHRSLLSALAASLVVVSAAAAAAAAAAAQRPVRNATVDIRDDWAPVNRFDPRSTFGAGIDGHGAGVVAKIFTRDNIAAMKSVGFSMATYRLRTELGVQAWHWNPRGRWSDSAHTRGYWTSDDHSSEPILLTHGYRLPRRGNTDEGENAAYSRLDDGDTATFWKSNPYLDHRFTGTADSLLPQWVIVDLGALKPVNAIRIQWGAPFAATYKVQYWQGEMVHDVDENPPGRWVTFAHGSERSGRGGDELRTLESSPTQARFVRIVMSASSNIGPSGSTDDHDAAGYAIRELGVGVLTAGTLHDEIRHGAGSFHQSTTYASSTDPWHRAEDIDLQLEQPGFDRVFQSGLTLGRAAMVPVPVLYGIPNDAAAELRFLRARGYPIDRVEMGEEPDGQFVTPEDYAALYAQTARAIRRDWPNAPLGGPGFQGLETRVMFAWPSDTTYGSWVPRFLSAIRERGKPGDFTFLSFEWYPWDNVCGATAPQLAAASARLADRLEGVHDGGIPTDFPMVIAEYGYSAFAGAAEVQIEGALLNADIVGRFLSVGGSAAYLYGWEPTLLDKASRCDTWGNNMLFLSDAERRITARVATFYGSRLLMNEWVVPAGGTHTMLHTESDARDSEGNELLSGYVVRRPDGTWATMLVNKSPTASYKVSLAFRSGLTAHGTRRVTSYSPAQYQWKAGGAKGRPSRSRPPVVQTVRAGARLIVPPYSITIVRERR
jgi:hypothetical protein